MFSSTSKLIKLIIREFENSLLAIGDGTDEWGDSAIQDTFNKICSHLKNMHPRISARVDLCVFGTSFAIGREIDVDDLSLQDVFDIAFYCINGRSPLPKDNAKLCKSYFKWRNKLR